MSSLLLLGLLPQVTVFGHPLRKVNVLSDLYPNTDTSELSAVDSTLLLPPPPKPVFVDTCRTGMVCIEDYSDTTLRGMHPFYQALDELAHYPRMVRVAYYGDSFVEGDILTSDLREMLQKRYGGRGIGYTPITSISSGFRVTVRQSSRGFSRHSIMDTIAFDRSLQDVSNHYFKADSTASIRFSGQTRNYAYLDTFARASFFFIPDSSVTITAAVNGKNVLDKEFEGDQLQMAEVEGKIGNVTFTVLESDSSALFYGVAMDDKSGVALDNFSMRGASGLNVRSIPAKMMRRFYQLRPYDLVILHYGLNVATQRGTNYDNYIRGMQTTIQHIKEYYPGAGILVVSVADRDYKTNEGEIETMPGIRNLVRYQQNLAAQESVAFWNLFEAMGGNASMKNLVEAKPAKANYDYTHINANGGKYLAKLLFDALVYGKDQYDRRRAYETSR
ncbi:MAG: SGNH/GDSL hydrolase family protein [Bacteroidaceae bacterium]|nr:SGNH/GDSL hydrolase family protein [Bacteroidaceae bacterium]